MALAYLSQVKKEDDALIIPVSSAEGNSSLGDRMGIADDELWIMVDYVTPDEKEVVDFLKSHLSNYRAVLGMLHQL